MTREEAIKILKSKMDGHTDTSYEWCECVRMSIQALEQEPCKDAISRKAVLDATVKKNSIWNKITNSKGESLEEIISQLPPVNPQPKTDVLDKIRAEIEQITDTMEVWYNQYVSKIDVLRIIDKYREGREE